MMSKGFFCLFLFFVLVLDFTCKFIASVSSCPSLDYNCKKRGAFPNYGTRQHCIFETKNEIGPQFFQQPRETMVRTTVQPAQ